MLPAQRAELQKGRVSMRTGNLPLTKTIRSSHANHEASSIDIVQQQRKFGKVNLRQLLSQPLPSSPSLDFGNCQHPLSCPFLRMRRGRDGGFHAGEALW